MMSSLSVSSYSRGSELPAIEAHALEFQQLAVEPERAGIAGMAGLRLTLRRARTRVRVGCSDTSRLTA